MHEVSRGRSPWPAVVLAVGGGALLVVGSFQAWSQISGGGTTAALYGVSDRPLAWVTLGAGIALLVLALPLAVTAGAARRVVAALVIVAAVVGGAACAIEIVTGRNAVLDGFAEQLSQDYGGTPAEMRELLDQAVGTGQLVLSTGIGVYLAIAGAALGVVGGVLGARRRAPTPEPAADATIAGVATAPSDAPPAAPWTPSDTSPAAPWTPSDAPPASAPWTPPTPPPPDPAEPPA